MRSIACVVWLAACWRSSPQPPLPPIPAATPPKLYKATVVTRTQYGGVIELRGPRSGAMELANDHMAEQCGDGNYQITQEGEEVTGARDDATGRTPVAWRVQYICIGAASIPSPP